MSFLLHASTGEHADVWHGIYEEVLLAGILDTLKIIPFLFLTYLFMEFIEHKASGRIISFVERAGALGPLAGSLVGAIPQCGFSASASNFYTGRVITLGTLVAVFLSTSDEMLPILISGKVSTTAILAILAYKAAVGILVGFAVDFALKLMNGKKEPINIDSLCDEDGCHCERGILFSAIHHTLSIGAFVLLITFAVNALVYFVGAENLAKIMYDKPFVSHLIAAAIGLIPNCAVSVALTNFAIGGFITAGTMLSGLFSGAGVGLLILFKVNKKLKQNFAVVGIITVAGIIFGILADCLNFSALL